MRAMHNAGTPMDLAVFDRVDDNDLLMTPPLVVAASGPERIGQLAAELPVERLAGLRTPPRHAVLAPVLLGPGERWIRSAARSSSRRAAAYGACPRSPTSQRDGPWHAEDGLVPANRTAAGPAAEPITG